MTLRIRRPPLTADQRRTLERRRHDRRFRRCEPVDHTPPWVKYSRRAYVSTIAQHDLGQVHRIAIMFSKRLQGIADSFGIESLGITRAMIGNFRRGAHPGRFTR